MKPSTLFALSFLVAISRAAPAFSADKNGFDLSTSLVDTNQIFFGGPPRDGIPALTRPAFVSLDAATFLDDEDRVLGLSADGQSKAYPITILNWHEIVNDQVGSMEVAVTYCPLCGTGAAFLAQVDGETLEFGVSGLLYNSDVLLYDRTTESLWSQIRAQAVTGPLAGKALVQVPLIHTSWAKWKKKHPDRHSCPFPGHWLCARLRPEPLCGIRKLRSPLFPD